MESSSHWRDHLIIFWCYAGKQKRENPHGWQANAGSRIIELGAYRFKLQYSAFVQGIAARIAPQEGKQLAKAAKNKTSTTLNGYRCRSFSRYLSEYLEHYCTLSPVEQNAISAVFWNMAIGRLTHNAGDPDLSPIHWRFKVTMFKTAKRFDELNALMDLFEARTRAKVGVSAVGWALSANAMQLWESYQDAVREQLGTGFDEQDNGLVSNHDGKTYRNTKDAIRAVTTTGNKTRFDRKQIRAAVEINGDNLHLFDHATTTWLAGEPAPVGFEWAHEHWNGIRNGRGINAGEGKARERVERARAQANTLLGLSKSTNALGFVVPTTYVESRAGRLYAEGTINLQRCIGEVRRAALSGCYDVDIENCHWALVSQMAARLGIDTPRIEHYLNNKQQFRAEVAFAGGISIDEAKFVMLATIYGATLAATVEGNKRDIAERIGNDAVERLRAYAPLMELFKEVNKAGKGIIKHYADKTAKVGVLVNDAKREISLKCNNRELLAHILQGAESCALQAMIKVLGGKVRLLQHDGLTVDGAPDTQKLEQAILDETGYKLMLESGQL